MKKLSAIILSMAIILCASTTAVAIDATVEDLELIMDNRYDCVAQEFNEYDYIQMLQNCSLDDLESAGMEKEEVDAAISQFEDALRLRSSLPEKQLLELGYSEEEISISVPASISISFGGSVVTSKTGGDQVQYNALTGKMTKLP